MGFYNPDAPMILGEEWVPILQPDLVLSPALNNVEYGHTFTLSGTKVLADGRFYINTPPSGDISGQTQFISIYPHGQENETGPIHTVLIPCNSATITGNALIIVNNASAPTLGPLALLDPSDGNSVTLSGGTPDDANLDMGFAVNGYAQLLNGKRILRVRLRYVATSANVNDFECYAVLSHATVGGGGTNNNAIVYGSTLDGTITAPEWGPGEPIYQFVDFGEVAFFAGTGLSPLATTERLPWTFQALQRFEQSIGSAQAVVVRLNAIENPDGTAIFFFYCALEVTYCEETRVAVGGQAYGLTNTGFTGLSRNYILGQNTLSLRSVPAFTANPVLTAGRYDVILSTPNTGIANVERSPSPIFNALRQLYTVPGLDGVRVLPTVTEGATYTYEDTVLLPQLSLHTSGGVIPEVHVYGRQAVGQVYGNNTVTQEILDSAAGANFYYPWVRYYARRYGDTTVSLTLSSASPTVSGAGFSVAITPAQWDALDEVVDRWKAVTLRFPDATPPVMGSGWTPTWRWSATGETAGNRWEVLGAAAPAMSGLAGNLLQLAVPSTTAQLPTATYGQPSAGSTVNMGWIPQLGPYVSGTTDDQTSDAVILFSQDPSPVSGFAISQLNQTLTGIGLDCGVTPSGIPSAITYNRLTWSGPTVTGFSTELQRMDTIDTDWQTIMLASTPTVSGFNDYEARVGILTSYRIRKVNLYDFVGPWSSTLTATIAEPGITIGDDGHVLIFTSNEDQSGSMNLAYSTAWEGRIEEQFSFAEASTVQLQPMYDRDFYVAFRTSERSGDQFSRQLLIQAAAISPPTLPGFTALTDMSWGDVSYICVRDEEGNKWLATVMVPSGRVVHFRKLYFANINIVEVTDTPSQVDP